MAAVVFYDRDCGFCRWTLGWLLRLDRRRGLRPVAIQSEEGDRLLSDLGPARLASWHVVRDGERRSGGEAFAPALEELPGGRGLAWLARRLERVLVVVYDWVAAHRGGLGRLVPGGAKRRADALVAAREHERHPVG